MRHWSEQQMLQADADYGCLREHAELYIENDWIIILLDLFTMYID